MTLSSERESVSARSRGTPVHRGPRRMNLFGGVVGRGIGRGAAERNVSTGQRVGI